MVISVLAILVMILGALVYALASNSKLSEMGRLAFFAGLLAELMATGQHAIRVFQ